MALMKADMMTLSPDASDQFIKLDTSSVFKVCGNKLYNIDGVNMFGNIQ